MQTVNLGLIGTTEEPKPLTVGLKRDLGLATDTGTPHGIVVAKEGGEAGEYVYVNLGFDIPEANGEAGEYMYVNVGLALNPEDEAGEYMYWNVDDAVALPPAHLVKLMPNFGSEGSAFRILALGAGATQVERSSQVLFGSDPITIDGWTHVPATAAVGEQYIDVDAGETNMEHQLIDVTVPADAQTSVVKVQQDDGA